MAVQTVNDTATAQARQVKDAAATRASEVASHATDAAGSVADTAKEQLTEVAQHAAVQGQQLAEQAQSQLAGEAERHTSTLAGNIRSLASELHTMAQAGSSGSPLQALLSQLAAKSESAATLLEEEGPDGLLREAQDFGRRRPGTFVLGALAAGFATTRLAKHASKVSGSTPTDPYPSGGKR